jgi:hypothetical protein
LNAQNACGETVTYEEHGYANVAVSGGTSSSKLQAMVDQYVPNNVTSDFSAATGTHSSHYYITTQYDSDPVWYGDFTSTILDAGRTFTIY